MENTYVKRNRCFYKDFDSQHEKLYLQEQDTDLTEGTRKCYSTLEKNNIQKRYASWTDGHGNLNYFTAQSIASFASIATLQSGLKELD